MTLPVPVQRSNMKACAAPASAERAVPAGQVSSRQARQDLSSFFHRRRFAGPQGWLGKRFLEMLGKHVLAVQTLINSR